MYDKLLTQVEQWLKSSMGKPESINEIINELDLIIKIKTIQYMDVQAELVAYSRRVSRN